MSAHFSGAVCFSVQKGSEIGLLKMQLGKPLEKILSFGETVYYSKQFERGKQSSRIQEDGSIKDV